MNKFFCFMFWYEMISLKLSGPKMTVFKLQIFCEQNDNWIWQTNPLQKFNIVPSSDRAESHLAEVKREEEWKGKSQWLQELSGRWTSAGAWLKTIWERWRLWSWSEEKMVIPGQLKAPFTFWDPSSQTILRISSSVSRLFINPLHF